MGIRKVVMAKKKKIVVIGGGTGTYTVLLGLKKYPIDLSVIVTMMDSGGSNRVLRDEFGLLPTSDLRQCIVALSSEDTDQTLRKLFTYRYSKGIGIEGMTFGNLFMAALTDIYGGDQKKAIEETCEILGVKGKIFPVTLENTNLVARYENGQQVLGEHMIDEPTKQLTGKRISSLSVFPPAKASSAALSAIKEADLIILGPGDLYTSVISNLVVDGVAKAVANTRAKRVFILNLMTRIGQTEGYKASDHIRELTRYLTKPCIDYCLVNNDTNFPKEALNWYKKVSTYPVEDDLEESGKMRVVRTPLFDKTIYKKVKGDRLIRSLIRHDSVKVAEAVMKLL